MLCCRAPLAGLMIVTVLGMVIPSAVSRAQAQSAEDQAIDVFRGNQTIGASDQSRIKAWVESRVVVLVAAANADGPGALQAFRGAVESQRTNPGNSAAFRTALAQQLGAVAASRFDGATLDRWTAQGMAQAMLEFNRVETIDGLVACLKSSTSVARYLCVRGLASQQRKIAGDNAKLSRVIGALKEAGESETDPVALAHIYLALSYPSQASAVVDAYLAILTKRIALRRGAAVAVDRAEVDAFEFFRNATVIGAMNNDQKSRLVNALAVFLRADAQRYDTADLLFTEIEAIEQRLQSNEGVLASLQGSGGGDIRGTLDKGGHSTNHQAVVAEAYRWVGDPGSKTVGALNQPPWDVPVGAP